MTTLALTVLAIGCVLAMAYAVFLRTANTALLRRLAEAEARARQAELLAGHAVDAATLPTKPIAENVATLAEGGLLTSPSIFGRAKPSVVVALLLALFSATPARAADLLPAGYAITSTSGETVILDDEYLLIDRGEVAGLTIMVRDLQRCQAALAECDAAPKPPAAIAPAKKSRLGWWVAAITGAFVAGYAANEYVTLAHVAEEPR